jgi:hypothetical protein
MITGSSSLRGPSAAASRTASRTVLAASSRAACELGNDSISILLRRFGIGGGVDIVSGVARLTAEARGSPARPRRPDGGRHDVPRARALRYSRGLRRAVLVGACFGRPPSALQTRPSGLGFALLARLRGCAAGSWFGSSRADLLGRCVPHVLALAPPARPLRAMFLRVIADALDRLRDQTISSAALIVRGSSIM